MSSPTNNNDIGASSLSLMQLHSAVWRTMEEASQAIHSFATQQGWTLATQKSEQYRYNSVDASGITRVAHVDRYKVWICSRGHHNSPNASDHECSDACSRINTTGVLPICENAQSRLSPSVKTGCPVSIRVVWIKRSPLPEEKPWSETELPISGYQISSKTKQLLPCMHNHTSNRSHVPLTERLAEIPEEARVEVEKLVRFGFQSYRIRQLITSMYNLPPITQTVWDSLIRSIRTNMGIQQAGDDLKALIEQLTEERNNRGAVFDFDVDHELSIKSIFFMSRAMIDSFHRSGQFVVMDSTCKTNRFGMNLFIACGIDEHSHIALYASAFMKEETEPSFQYVLQQMKRAVGEEAWMRMTCVATDGCTAMTNALRSLAPHTSQQRCVWHLQQNIMRHVAGSKSPNQIIALWYQAVYAKTEKDFKLKWSVLIQSSISDKCRQYLTQTILPLHLKWACYATSHLTNFGSHSTQIVESMNRLLKMWDVNDRCTLTNAIGRIVRVKEEEEMKRHIASTRDNSLRFVASASASSINVLPYREKVARCLTGGAVTLCTEQYNLYSQYRATPKLASIRNNSFSRTSQSYLVRHRHKEGSEYQVQVSRSFIYCSCGHVLMYLLPCRHILAATGEEYEDIFQLDQHHPRWRVDYSKVVERELLSKQLWIHLSEGGTSAVQAVAEERKSMDDGVAVAQQNIRLKEEERKANEVEMSASSLPSPMYPQFHLTELTPQRLFHMIDGTCQELRQLVCTHPALLSHTAWWHLNELKMKLTSQITNEERRQNNSSSSAAAPLASSFTSAGTPLTSLLAPVPLTSSKPGRPSKKRSIAVMEGRASKKITAMVPAIVTSDGYSSSTSVGIGIVDVGGDVVMHPVDVSSVMVAAAVACSSGSDALVTTSNDILVSSSSHSSMHHPLPQVRTSGRVVRPTKRDD